MNRRLKGGYMDRFYHPLFIAPGLIIFFIFFILPVVFGFGFSFTDWNQYLTEINFIGLKNFQEIFEDRVSMLALKNTLIFASVTTVGKNVLGLGLALILNTKLRGENRLAGHLFLSGHPQHHCGGPGVFGGAPSHRSAQ